MDIDRQSNARPLLADIKTFTVYHLNMQQFLALMQRIKALSIPKILENIFYFMNYSYPMRFSKNTLKQPHATINYGKLSIGPRDPQVWNRFLFERKKNGECIVFQNHGKKYCY